LILIFFWGWLGWAGVAAFFWCTQMKKEEENPGQRGVRVDWIGADC
jgi:hypothetical protein